VSPPRKPPPPATVPIDRIGSEGDGVGRLPDGKPVYVPLTLPGELVLARPVRPIGDGWLAVAEAVEEPGEARIAPPCRHFDRCGGCVLQHWQDGAYRAWKVGMLSYALRQASFTVPEPLAFHPGLPGERRRIDFAVRRAGGRIILGLHAPRSTEVIDLSDCLVLHPTLMALMGPLRPLLNGLRAVKREASVVVNLLDSGPDMLLRTDAPLSLDDRNALTAFARTHGLPRISWAAAGDTPETICLLRPSATT
jgi:23S rRNA (uracil1939-C5)-methyltransferase